MSGGNWLIPTFSILADGYTQYSLKCRDKVHVWYSHIFLASLLSHSFNRFLTSSSAALHNASHTCLLDVHEEMWPHDQSYTLCLSPPTWSQIWPLSPCWSWPCRGGPGIVWQRLLILDICYILMKQMIYYQFHMVHILNVFPPLCVKIV